jgi:hypothetical protein
MRTLCFCVSSSHSSHSSHSGALCENSVLEVFGSGLAGMSNQLPIRQEFNLMLGNPLDHESECPRFNAPFQHLQCANVDYHLLPAILRMEVRRVEFMKEHGNNNAIESAYFRHCVLPCHSCSCGGDE